MKRKLIIIFLFINLSFGQNLLPGLFKINRSAFDSTAYKGLKSNMISDLVPQADTLLWLGTGSGLALLRDTTSIVTISSKAEVSASLTDVTPTGGVTALAVSNKTMFAAFAKSGDNITIGNGLIYSTDATGKSIDWSYFDQPIDTKADSLAPFAKRFFKGLPITVKEANVTYDAAISGNYIWITSWAGGLDPQDGGNHNHKAFSVIAYSDTVWVGTANGINRGLIGANGCIDWTHYTPIQNGLSGGFVVDLEIQRYKGYDVIWAATVSAGSGEKNAISFSMDNGDTWNTTLIGERAYNITAADSIVLVASKSGLWKTVTDNPMDIAKPWAKYNSAKQAIRYGSTGIYNMDEILSQEVIGVSYDKRPFYSSSSTIWIGTWDGMARAIDRDGTNWQIYRTKFDVEKVYAYPNPFSPFEHNQIGGSGYVHIYADVKTSFVVKMDIFNFGMEPVLQKQFDRRQTTTGALKWDGKDKNGRIVDNGTYFIRLEYDQKIKWIKLVVIK